MNSTTHDWGEFWDSNAERTDHLSATGRGGMGVVGFLHTVRAAARILELSPADKLLDIGCGTGIFAMALSPVVKRIHGVDISPVMIERAKSSFHSCDGMTFSTGTLCEPGVSAGNFNKVLAYSVLQYLADQDEVLEAFRVLFELLPEGGRALYAANPDTAKRDAYLEKTLAGRSDETECQRIRRIVDQVLWLAPSDVAALARDAGLTAHVEPISPDIWQHFYMYDLVLEKP